nr:hypothetical protein [Solirubrobacterales bacterium]
MREISPGAVLPFEEAVALAPWDYGGPEHIHRAPLVMIVAADGTVLDWEPALGDLLAPDARSDERPTCCRWLGCHGGGDGPLAAACLTRLTLDGGGTLDELELPRGPLLGAALAVRSLPLTAGATALAFLVRPAAARQRLVEVRT